MWLLFSQIDNTKIKKIYILIIKNVIIIIKSSQITISKYCWYKYIIKNVDLFYCRSNS